MECKIKQYKSELSLDGGFELYKRLIPAGTVYPLHWHNFFEFEIIVDGKGIHTYNNNVYPVDRGSAFMMSYYDFHSLTALTDITLYCIHFDESTIDKKTAGILSTSINKFHFDFDAAGTEKIKLIMERLESETSGKDVLRDIMIKNLVSEIVIEMIRKSTDGTLQSSMPAVQQIMAYVNANFRKHINLETIAGDLSFTPNYLGHIFKQHAGSTFNEYLNTMRLKYACNLLTVSDLSVKEIAFESGYNSVEYFMYIFKKKIMMTPGEYRKRK